MLYHQKALKEVSEYTQYKTLVPQIKWDILYAVTMASKVQSFNKFWWPHRIIKALFKHLC